jgi:type IV pilus assembly protein PilQ
MALVAALILSVAVLQAESAAPGAAGAPPLPEPPAPSATHRLLDLNVDSAEPGTARITLSTDAEVDYEALVLDGPDRLVLDLQSVVSLLDGYEFEVGHSGVTRVRAAQYRREPLPVTRVVFDLEQPLAWTVEPGVTGLVVVFDAFAELPVPAADADPVEEADPIVEAAAPAQAAPGDEDADVTRIVEEMEARYAEMAAAEEPPALGDWPEPVEPVDPAGAEFDRAVSGDLIDRLVQGAPLAAPAPQEVEIPASFESKRISASEIQYTGQEISLNLVDADIKQIFRLFHEISGLNFVLDPGVGGRVTVVLDHVPWDQALDIILKNNGLDKELERNVIRIASTSKLAQEAASRKQLKDAAELEVELVTITRTLSYAKAKDLESTLRRGTGSGGRAGLLSTRGRIIVDERTNTLIITDVPKKVSQMDALLTTLDAETPQVMIEARVVETSRDYTRDLGIVWGVSAAADAAHGTATGLSFPHNINADYALNLPGEGGASALAFKFGNVVDSFTLDLQLNALETDGVARVLSSPKVATQNNERAEIEQGVRIPIVNTTATEIAVEFVSASLKMSTTPQITAEGTIILEVIVENNSPDFVNTAGGIPSIRTQRAQTKVLIPDGGTTVIGGIFTVNEGQSEVGVPWFRKIPGFGWLFRAKNITNSNRELLIFLTPKIMRVS